MVASSTPAWLTAVVAVVAGFFGLSGTIVLDRRRRQELDQDRLLHASDARLSALTGATGTALLYREQIMAAILLILREPPRVGVDLIWSWTPEHRVTCRTHEAELVLLFGAKHPVTSAWQSCSWYLAEAAEFAKVQRNWSNSTAGSVPPDIVDEATKLREKTRDALDHFLAVGGESAALIQPQDRARLSPSGD